MSRINSGEGIAAAGGLLLLIALVLPWYAQEETLELLDDRTVTTTVGTYNAFESFAIADLLLFAVVLLAVGMAVARATDSMPSGLPWPPALIVAAAGVFALLIVLFRLLNAPGLDTDLATGSVDIGRRIGIFLALIAGAAITYGGYRALTERAGRSRQ